MIATFLKKYIIAVIAILLLLVLLVVKMFKNKPSDKEQEADKVISNIASSIDEANKKRLAKLARDVAHHLGTAYAWYDPRHWTENDEKVFDLIKNLGQSEFDVVSIVYHDVYAKGNTLTSDLAKLLDTKYYTQLSF